MRSLPHNQTLLCLIEPPVSIVARQDWSAENGSSKATGRLRRFIAAHAIVHGNRAKKHRNQRTRGNLQPTNGRRGNLRARLSGAARLNWPPVIAARAMPQ
jgi:hypothetical protein